jgi:radical SAM protein with 4Fe4S-binding SPASM domain
MHRLAVFWDGNVTTCCGDYNNRFQLGNVKRKTIEEIWMSTKMRTFRKLHKENKRNMMAICKHCVACIGPKNDEALIDETKCHIDDYSYTM